MTEGDEKEQQQQAGERNEHPEPNSHGSPRCPVRGTGRQDSLVQGYDPHIHYSTIKYVISITIPTAVQGIPGSIDVHPDSASERVAP